VRETPKGETPEPVLPKLHEIHEEHIEKPASASTAPVTIKSATEISEEIRDALLAAGANRMGIGALRSRVEESIKGTRNETIEDLIAAKYGKDMIGKIAGPLASAKAEINEMAPQIIDKNFVP
jgi:hypothetical protein